MRQKYVQHTWAQGYGIGIKKGIKHLLIHTKSHHQIIKEIYNSLDLPVNIISSEEAKLPEIENQLISYYCPGGSLKIEAASLTSSTINSISKLIKEKKEENLKYIQLLLPLENKYCSYIAEKLVKKGFAFAGVLPWIKKGQDLLLFHMILEPEFKIADCIIETEQSKKLFDYIVTDIKKQKKAVFSL